MIDNLAKLHQRQSGIGHWSISRPEHNYAYADSSGARKRCASAPVVDKLRGNWIPLFLKSRKSYYNNSLLKVRSEKSTVGVGRCSHAAIICKRLSLVCVNQIITRTVNRAIFGHSRACCHCKACIIDDSKI